MKTNVTSIFAVTAFLILVLTGFASALTITSVTSPTTAIHNSQVAFTVNITAAENTSLYWSSSSATNGATWISLPTVNTMNAGDSVIGIAVLNVPQYSFGSIVPTLVAKNSSGSVLATLSFLTVTINNTSAISISASSTTLNQANNRTTITITNTGNIDFTNVQLNITSLDGATFSLSPSTFVLAKGTSKDVSLNATISSSLNLGSQTATITASASTGLSTVSITQSISLEKSYCNYGEVGSDVKILSIEDRSAGDEWNWEPLKDISIEVETRNNNPDNSEKIYTKIGLYDKTDDKFIKLNGDKTELDQSVKIAKDGESEILRFEFTLPADLKSDHNYQLYVKSYQSGHEDTQCNSKTSFSGGSSNVFSQPISIDITREVILGDISIGDFTNCGSTATLTATVYNVDASDNEKIKVRVYNTELKIDQTYELLNQLDVGDSEDISIPLNVPKDALEKTYNLKAVILYDYSDNSNAYRQSLSQNDILLKVEGNCAVVPRVNINAALASEAKSGNPLSIKVTIVNTASTSQTFNMIADGYSNWATLTNISESQFTLAPAETKDVYYNFVVNNGVSGDNQFTIRALSNNGASIKEQAVSVNVAAGSGFNFTGFNFGNWGNSWYIWAIVALNVVLIIVIIIVAIKLLK